MSEYSNMQAYEGALSFAYACFDPSDKDVALPPIQLLQNKGFRIWFDKFASPDEDLAAQPDGPFASEVVAQPAPHQQRTAAQEHLAACRCFICFLTEAAARNPQCVSAIEYAINHKDSLGIVIVNFGEKDPSVGVEHIDALLSDLQHIFYNRHSSIESFCEALAIGEALQPIKDTYRVEKHSSENIVLEHYIGGSPLPELPEGITSIAAGGILTPNARKITIPEGVTKIGFKAFTACGNARAIELPSTLLEIERAAFYGCLSLENIVVPEGVTSIPDSAFNQCVLLKEVHLPSTITSIGVSAFEGCESLTHIDLPEGLQSIGRSAFQGCKSLQLQISAGVTDLGPRAFAGTNELTISPDNTAYEIVDGVIVSTDYMTLVDATFMKNPHLPAVATVIGASAFEGCTDLVELELYAWVHTIHSCAFKDCTRLRSVRLLDSLDSIEPCAFEGCTSLTELYIPGSYEPVILQPDQDPDEQIRSIWDAYKATHRPGAMSTTDFAIEDDSPFAPSKATTREAE